MAISFSKPSSAIQAETVQALSPQGIPVGIFDAVPYKHSSSEMIDLNNNNNYTIPGSKTKA